MTDFRLYWWRPKRDWINLGDEISPHVLAHVTWRSIIHAPDHLCDGIAIGSVFNPRRARAKKRATPLFVWGSGTLAPSPCEFKHLSVIMAALRGPRTHGQIIGCPELPFGDPGLFVREIWPKQPLSGPAPGSPSVAAPAVPPAPGTAAARRAAAPAKPAVGGRIGLIPHHGQLRSPQIAGLAAALEGAELLDFTAPDIAATLGALSRCRLIVSSSLHGLILADSYGIPSLFWNEGGAANEWKYRDYFEGVGREDFAGLTAAEILSLLAVGPVEDLPFSQLSEARLAQVLADLRAAAGRIPEGPAAR